jgi:hypothetical protein
LIAHSRDGLSFFHQRGCPVLTSARVSPHLSDQPDSLTRVHYRLKHQEDRRRRLAAVSPTALR